MICLFCFVRLFVCLKEQPAMDRECLPGCMDVVVCVLSLFFPFVVYFVLFSFV